MPEIRMLIADKDEDYSRSLLDYLACCSPGWEIVSFTAENLLSDYLKGAPAAVDIVLVSEDFILPQELLPKQCTILRLVEGGTEHASDQRTINKYQCGDILIKRVMEVYVKDNPQAHVYPGSGEKTRIIGVFSATGGSGKTVIAMGLSMQLSWEGKKVFYLNMEGASSTELFLDGQQANSLSGILYYLKNEAPHVQAKIEEAKCIDPVSGISHFICPDSMLDLKENLAGEITMLVTRLAAGGHYDFLVIDMSDHLDGNNLILLKACDSILLVCLDDPISELKTRHLLREFALLTRGKNLQLANKSQLVLNKHPQGSTSDAQTTTYCGWSIRHRIPLVKNLLVQHGGKYRPDLNGPFGTALHRLSKDL